MPELGRNEPCHCGSGKKYKKCHLEKDEAKGAKERHKAALNAEKLLKEKVEAAEESAQKSSGKPQQKRSWFHNIRKKVGMFGAEK